MCGRSGGDGGGGGDRGAVVAGTTATLQVAGTGDGAASAATTRGPVSILTV